MTTLITATRFHDCSFGHRVAGHESKCAMLHGHNYRVHFTMQAPELDKLGRVIDFSVMKSRLCEWLEIHYDHRFLAWEKDEEMRQLLASAGLVADKDVRFLASPLALTVRASSLLDRSIVWVPYNPTAENIARYLLCEVGPLQLVDTEVTLIEVTVEETRKCSATARLK